MNPTLPYAFSQIIHHIPYKGTVLDLGCGTGELLDHLMKEKNVKGYGIEIDLDSILTCIKRTIPVYQGNIDDGLSGFKDQSYDVVILSLTLQQIQKPLFVLQEMVRVGKKAIVMFPNFGYWRIRLQLLLEGKSPVTPTLPYQWHDTPNIRVVTINDFKQLCRLENIQIEHEIPLLTHPLTKWLGTLGSNYFSEKGLFVLSKKTN